MSPEPAAAKCELCRKPLTEDGVWWVCLPCDSMWPTTTRWREMPPPKAFVGSVWPPPEPS